MSSPNKRRVFNGMTVPRFRPGASRPNPLSAADMNLLADIARVFVNPEIRYGDSNAVFLSDSNWVIQIKRSGGSGSSASVKLTVVAHYGDYIECEDADGNTYKIAKPGELRFSLASRTVDGILFTYSAYDLTDQTRHVAWTDGVAQTEDQVIVPRYVPGATIWADPVSSTGVTVSGTELTWLERQDGRSWAKIRQDVSGSVALSNGQYEGSVTGLALPSAPKQVFLQVGGMHAVATYTNATTDGFDWSLSAAASGTDMQLDYLIIL